MILASSAVRWLLKMSSNITGSAIRPGERHSPVRIFVDGSRLVLQLTLAHGVCEERGSAAVTGSKSDNGAGLRRFPRSRRPVASLPELEGYSARLPDLLFGLKFFVQRASQDAKLITEPDMVTG